MVVYQESLECCRRAFVSKDQYFYPFVSLPDFQNSCFPIAIELNKAKVVQFTSNADKSEPMIRKHNERSTQFTKL